METKNKIRYVEGIGRRKTAVARVRLYKDAKQGIIVNDKDYNDYFKTDTQRSAVTIALEKVDKKEGVGVTVRVSGSGLSAQAEAIRHGVSRALLQWDEEIRGKLKRAGFLTRDSRMVERKKPGLKKARRSPQWSKR